MSGDQSLLFAALSALRVSSQPRNIPTAGYLGSVERCEDELLVWPSAIRRVCEHTTTTTTTITIGSRNRPNVV